MKSLLNKIFAITVVAAFLCKPSAEAQVSNPQLKIKDYKLKHNPLLQLKKDRRLKNLDQNSGIQINPYWQDVNAPHLYNSFIPQVQIPAFNAVWAKVDFDSLDYDANRFLQSSDGGKTWRYDSVDAPLGYGLSGIAPIDANICYAAMYDDFNYGGAMFKTTDGGDTWKQLEPGKLYSANSFPDIVYFFDAWHGVTIGDDDGIDTSRMEIYTTSNAGKTWQRIPGKNIPPTQGYAFSGNQNSFSVFQNRLWFTAGDSYGNSYIYRSDDFGNHWQQFPLTVTFYDFAFADRQNGLGVSYDDNGAPHEVATYDGGNTWANKSFTGYPMGFFLTVIPFTHTFVSTIPHGATRVGGSSYSNDYGTTWKLIDTTSDFNPTAVAFLNPLVGWCGRGNSTDPNGGMYKWKYHFSLDGNENTAVATDDRVAITKNNTTSLSVYPNPLTNATNISFTLPQTQEVSIQVFDGAGRLVKTIANEQMQAGAHQLLWEAAGASKGMYYLKFKAGSYSETKKLAVIK